jgi:hypothetical protein
MGARSRVRSVGLAERKGRRARALAHACGAIPRALETARALALVRVKEREFCKSSGVALAGLRRADAAGHSYAGSRLSAAAMAAVTAGALGGDPYRLGAMRPLLEGARRRLGAAKAVPRGSWAGADASPRNLEVHVAAQRAAGAGDDTRMPLHIGRVGAHPFEARSCVVCGGRGYEMLRCVRCRAPFCGRECQRAHWPEHKAACKATAAAAAAATDAGGS